MANLTRRDQLALEAKRARRKKALGHLKIAGISGGLGVVIHWLPLIGFVGWPFIIVALLFAYSGVTKLVSREKKDLQKI